MNILVIGGTRFMGVHLVKELLEKGHYVTIATRGITLDTFGEKVNRIILDRSDEKSMSDALGGRYFDIIYDNIAYCSNDVKYLLDIIKCKRYIQISTLSVYSDFHLDIVETEFDPLTHPFEWCTRDDYTYDGIKRQAECAIVQVYHQIPSILVRFPYVIGEDDYTKRLYFYIDHVVNSKPMDIDNLDQGIAFVHSEEAGKFLAWLTGATICGAVNAASYGNITLKEIISYVENKTGIKAIYSSSGEKGPYNGTPAFCLDLSKSKESGYQFTVLNTWIYKLIDKYIMVSKNDSN